MIKRRLCARNAFTFLKFPENATTVLTKILFDISFSLRELARFYLRQNKIQPTEIYKDALINHDRPLPIIIMGLAEAGHKDDFKLIEPYLNDSTVKVKSACIYAVFKLKPANRQQLILAQLPTAESMVIKTIYTGLVKYHDDYDIDAIKSIFCQKNDMMAEFFFMKLKLSTIKDCWSLIDYILDGLINYSDNQIMLYLQQKLSHWLVVTSPNSIFTRPNESILNLIMTKTEKLISCNQDMDLYRELKNTLLLFLPLA